MAYSVPSTIERSLRALIERVRERGTPIIVDPQNRLSLVHVEDLAHLYVGLLEAEAPPSTVNGVASILPWPEVIRAIANECLSSNEWPPEAPAPR